VANDEDVDIGKKCMKDASVLLPSICAKYKQMIAFSSDGMA